MHMYIDDTWKERKKERKKKKRKKDRYQIDG